MSRAKNDLAGRRFGRLVAVREVGRTRAGPVWLCRCDCGEMTEALEPALRFGTRVSCGCGRRGVRVDLSGRRIGRWQVLRRAAPDAEGGVRWLCRCACGTERAITHRNLLGRRTLSCGCVPRGRPQGTGDPALVPRDRAITAARGRGETLAAIADRFGLSRERVRQIVQTAKEGRPIRR